MKVTGAFRQIERKAVVRARQGAAAAMAIDFKMQDISVECTLQQCFASRDTHQVLRAALLHLDGVLLLMTMQGEAVCVRLIEAPRVVVLPR